MNVEKRERGRDEIVREEDGGMREKREKERTMRMEIKQY